MSIRTDLTNLGVAGPLAAEIERQISAQTGDARRLRELGFIAGDVLASGITSGNVNVVELAELGTPTEVARYIGANVTPPAPPPEE